MNRLPLKLLFKKYKFLSLAITIVSAIAFILFVALNSFVPSLTDGLNKYIEDYYYPDAIITVENTSIAEAEKIKELDFISDVRSRINVVTLIKKNGVPLSVYCCSFENNEQDKFFFWDKSSKLNTKPEIYLDFNFARDNGISAGDLIDLSLRRKSIRCFVRAIVSAPENLGVRKPDGWGSEISYGFLYFDKISLGDEYADLCNQFLIDFEDLANPDYALEEVCNLLKTDNVTVKESFNYEKSPVKAVINDNLHPISVLCKLIPVIFFTITLIIVFFTFSIFVHLQQKEIGILMGLGFLKKEIIVLFFRYVIVLSIVAIGISLPVCKNLLYIFSSIYKDYFTLPELNDLFDKKTFIIGVFATISVDMLATWYGCRSVCKMNPGQAIRYSHNVSEISSCSSVQKSKLFNKADPLSKFILSTMFRSRKRFYFVILCIAVVTSLVFAALGFTASCNYCVGQLFDERIHYDAMAIFSEMPSDTTIELLKEHKIISYAEKAKYYKRDICGESAVIVATEEGSELICASKDVKTPAQGIILERKFSQIIDASVGDTVLIGDTSITVSGISVQTTSKMQFISLKEAEKLGNPDGQILLCNVEDKEIFEEIIRSMDNLLGVISIEDEKKNAKALFDMYDLPVDITLIFSIAIGFIIISITAGTSFIERKKETAIILSQGFVIKDMLKGWLLCSLIQFVLGTAFGLPFGIAITKIVLSVIEINRRTYLYVSGLKEIIQSAGFVFLCVLAGNIVSFFIVKRWNIAEKLKSGE